MDLQNPPVRSGSRSQPCVIRSACGRSPDAYRTKQWPSERPIHFAIGPAICAWCNLANIYYMSKQYAEMVRLLQFLQMCLVCSEGSLVWSTTHCGGTMGGGARPAALALRGKSHPSCSIFKSMTVLTRSRNKHVSLNVCRALLYEVL